MHSLAFAGMEFNFWNLTGTAVLQTRQPSDLMTWIRKELTFLIRTSCVKSSWWSRSESESATTASGSEAGWSDEDVGREEDEEEEGERERGAAGIRPDRVASGTNRPALMSLMSVSSSRSGPAWESRE